MTRIGSGVLTDLRLFDFTSISNVTITLDYFPRFNKPSSIIPKPVLDIQLYDILDVDSLEASTVLALKPVRLLRAIPAFSYHPNLSGPGNGGYTSYSSLKISPKERAVRMPSPVASRLSLHT